MKNLIAVGAISCCLLFLSINASAQFAPAAGIAGTTAMHKDSSAFVAWATRCHVVRGLQDISVTTGAYANVGDSSAVFGIAGTTGVVSLGDNGYAVVEFANPIMDGPGPDLAVFENSFNDSFLELAFVEVSSDGGTFFRFPAISNTDVSTQTGSFGSTDPTMIHNLAGKYRSLYGTPFDLADIPDNLLLDKQAITHVKVIDVVGCVQALYGTRDKNNQIVNDPWPTAFGSGGFDLDAVGVIHEKNTTTSLQQQHLTTVRLYPNPAKELVWVATTFKGIYTAIVSNVLGEEVRRIESSEQQLAIPLTGMNSGLYTLTLLSEKSSSVARFIKVD